MQRREVWMIPVVVDLHCSHHHVTDESLTSYPFLPCPPSAVVLETANVAEPCQRHTAISRLACCYSHFSLVLGTSPLQEVSGEEVWGIKMDTWGRNFGLYLTPVLMTSIFGKSTYKHAQSEQQYPLRYPLANLGFSPSRPISLCPYSL